MDTIAVIFAALAASLAFATWHARRLGNDRRDVAFLGVTTGLLGLGSVVSAAI